MGPKQADKLARREANKRAWEESQRERARAMVEARKAKSKGLNSPLQDATDDAGHVPGVRRAWKLLESIKRVASKTKPPAPSVTIAASQVSSICPDPMVAPFLYLKSRVIENCRVDAAAFAAYVFDWDRCRMHDEWHALCDKHKRIVIMAFRESGKSQELTIARTLWDLGRDPTLNFAIIANTAAQSKERGQQLREVLSDNERLHEVFPDLYPGNKDSDEIINVRKRPGGLTGYNVRCFGTYGPVRQSRLDRIIFDDICDQMNTLTELQRDKLYRWVMSDVVGALSARGRAIGIGNALHREDTLHRLGSGNPKLQGKGKWPFYKYRVLADDGTINFPANWTFERIRERREELGTLDAAREMDCEPRDDSTAEFKQEWIDRALARGKGKLRHDVDPRMLADGSSIFTGMDLAVKARPKSDLSAMDTVLFHPSRHRQLLWIEAGKWQVPEMLARITDHHERYSPIIIVENAGQQQLLVDTAKWLSPASIRTFTTGSSSETNLVFQAAHLANEFERDMWTLPSDETGERPANEEIAALCHNLLYWTRGEHVPDRLAALLFARSGAPKNPYTPPRADEPGEGIAIQVSYAAVEGGPITMFRRKRNPDDGVWDPISCSRGGRD